MRLTETSIINSLAFRGDTRPPEEIFSNGFHNRQTPEFQFMQNLLLGGEDLDLELKVKIDMKHLNTQQVAKFDDSGIPKAAEPFSPHKTRYRVWLKDDPNTYIVITLKSTEGLTSALWKHYIDNLPVYREDRHDISPKTAVCLTLRPQVAPYFPIEGCSDEDGEWIWIYAVALGAAYKTYTYQIRDGSDLAAAREVAVEHVASNHVLCAIRCWRKGKYPDMQFLLSPRICWNPVAGGERLLAKKQIMAAFQRHQSMKTTVTRCVTGTIVRDSLRLFSEPPYPYWLWQK
ncbi:hypothetical protein ACLB1G_02385 [Oxalobacteraceae bacterium A2-2]